jgi:hypothetical protein
MSNFHAISLQVKSYSYFPKLNDEVWRLKQLRINYLMRRIVFMFFYSH